jgi:hypothetical protein
VAHEVGRFAPRWRLEMSVRGISRSNVVSFEYQHRKIEAYLLSDDRRLFDNLHAVLPTRATLFSQSVKSFDYHSLTAVHHSVCLPKAPCCTLAARSSDSLAGLLDQ